jgi:predicted dehydrogenase
MTNRPFRIGLMGCGTVANYGHLPAIARTPGIELVALFDPSESHLRDTAAKFGVAGAFASVDAFFATGLDAVIVTSPAPAHLDNVRAAAAAGVHVLCEKPLADTAEDGRAMVDAMARAGRMLLVGFTYRYSPVSGQIRDLVRSGAVGRVRALRLVYNWTLHGKYAVGPAGERVLNARREGRMAEGGPMVDCGVHQIDLARWWLGSDVVRQHAHAAWFDDHAAPEHVWLHLDHADGAHTLVEMSYAYGHTAKPLPSVFTYELIGTDGVIRYDRNAKVFEVLTPAGTRTLEWHEEKGFDGMYAALVRSLAAGQPLDFATGEDALRVTEIALSGTRQAMRDRARR